ncbi:hypothetical protein Y032_0019g3890 [Ancylostoma ceylanicum]|uniref:Uncharacterized protein n=1 Tax=Ancylostoma ceylanicum TaxID=53326 RepID=A0A016V1P2_9BILA|nr:hypothetical protein Y032_0019g3890 [Ancylostoma ceylanicum]
MMKKSVPDKLQNEFCGGGDDATTTVAAAAAATDLQSLTDPAVTKCLWGVMDCWLAPTAATDPFPPSNALLPIRYSTPRNLRVFRSLLVVFSDQRP